MAEWIQSLNAHAPDILRVLGLMEIQIAILALLVLAVERRLRRPLPKMRYALWLVMLAKCLLPPFLTMPEPAQIAIANFESAMLAAVVVADASTAGAAPAFSPAAILLIFWLAASLALLFMALRRYWRLRIELRDTKPVALPESLIKNSSKFAWPPIWQVERLATPVARGLIRPQIYLTGAAAKSDRAALQAILYHELAHVLRRDGWTVLLQTLAQILHPFNPFVWLMNLRLFRYREEICDDFALQNTAMPPRRYGEILLQFLETNAASPVAVQAGTCFFETANGFKQRFKYLLSPKEAAMNRFNWKHKLLVGGLLLMLPIVSWQCNNRPDAPTAPATAEGKIILPANLAQYDQPPQIVKRAATKYPQLALKAGMNGIVWVKLKIDETGKVEEVRVEKSTTPNLGFEEAALTAAMQFEFAPAKFKQQPVAAWVTIPFNFKIAAGQAAVQGQYFQFNWFNPTAVVVLPDDKC
jgi:TonB family protein